jgi:hypothetical protein
VLSLTFATMFNSTTFSSSRRRLQRAKPSGAGEQVRAISFASAAPSKIRGRAEFGLYLRFSIDSNPSSTSCCRVRATLLMLVSSAAAIALSLQPSPACLQENARSRQQLRRALACANQRFEPLALLRCQPHNVFLYCNLFPGHESPPPLPCGDRDSEERHIFKDAGD